MKICVSLLKYVNIHDLAYNFPFCNFEYVLVYSHKRRIVYKTVIHRLVTEERINFSTSSAPVQHHFSTIAVEIIHNLSNISI